MTMEEIDSIIIHSLKNLHCAIDENIHSLKQFDSDAIVNAISCCLEAIIPQSKFPKRLPPSMSLRLKLATNLVEQIKDLGFRGDLGYQSILYCNDVEIRRVLMFLIERLPRETQKTAENGEIGYVPRLVKEIERRVKMALEKRWVPTSLLYQGARDCGDAYLWQSFGNSCPLSTQSLSVPQTQENMDETFRDYWSRNLLSVTSQCSKNDLIPSLLFKDNEFSKEHLHSSDFDIPQAEMAGNATKFSKKDIEIAKENVSQTDEHLHNKGDLKSDELDQHQILSRDIQITTGKIQEISGDIRANKHKLSEVIVAKANQEELLKEIENKIQIKTKTLTVLSKEENMAKLRNLIEKGRARLLQLSEQWDQVQKPLLEEYNGLLTNLNAKESMMFEESQKLQNVRQMSLQLSEDLKKKEQLELQLVQKCEQSGKNTNRNWYTKRILEIISNIKKQNGEIQKILEDTVLVQKEINSLNGQVDRSFTLADELIFRDAKHDEMARKAYKYTANLHGVCGDLVKLATDLGQIERECSNLQEQIDSERDKDIETKLNSALTDLEQIKRETDALLKS